MMRLTYVAAGDPEGLRTSQYAEMADGGDDLYRTNIQIGELNSINASLALIRYKQLKGFYVDATDAIHLLFDVTDLKTASIIPGGDVDGEDEDDAEAA
jgi:hypothetical protein